MICHFCIHSIYILIQFECFICLESIRNKFMPLGNNLFAAKLKYLQRGGGCCKKRGKKLTKLIWWKIPYLQFFFRWKEGILIRIYPRNPKKWSRCSTTTIFGVNWEFLLKKDWMKKKLTFSLLIFYTQIALIAKQKKIERCGCGI